MNALEKIKAWIATYPGFNILSAFQVDYASQIPGSGSISPDGLVEVARRRDIIGNVAVTNQYNFGLYYVFEKSPGDDASAAVNADWIMGFQEWVQEQSVTRKAPVFGDEPGKEKITAQNGVLYDAGKDGTATYMVQLSVEFIRKYKEENQWLT